MAPVCAHIHRMHKAHRTQHTHRGEEGRSVWHDCFAVCTHVYPDRQPTHTRTQQTQRQTVGRPAHEAGLLSHTAEYQELFWHAVLPVGRLLLPWLCSAHASGTCCEHPSPLATVQPAGTRLPPVFWQESVTLPWTKQPATPPTSVGLRGVVEELCVGNPQGAGGVWQLLLRAHRQGAAVPVRCVGADIAVGDVELS